MKPSPQSKLLTYPSLPPNFPLLRNGPFWGFPWLYSGWLRTPSSGGPGLIPGQGTRSHMLQLKIPHAATKTWCSQIKKWRKRGLCNAFPFPRELLIYFPSVYVTLHFLEFYGNGIIHSVLYHFYLYLIYWYLLLVEHPGCWEGHMKNILTYYGSICGSTTCEQYGSLSEFSKVQFL